MNRNMLSIKKINSDLTSRKFLNVGCRLGNTMTSQLRSYRSFLINSKSIYNKKNCNCENCNTLEDETHYLLHCPLYAVKNA